MRPSADAPAAPPALLQSPSSQVALRGVPPRAIAQFAADKGFSLEDHIVLVATSGSRSYNLEMSHADAQSDHDFLIVVQPPVTQSLGLDRFDSWSWKEDNIDIAAHSVEKMVFLASRQNPLALTALWLRPEECLIVTPAWQRLVDARNAFLSSRVYQTFAGHADKEIARMSLFDERAQVDWAQLHLLLARTGWAMTDLVGR